MHLEMSLKIEFSAGRSMNFGAITLSNPDSQVPERSKHRKTFRIKSLIYETTEKDTFKAPFCTE